MRSAAEFKRETRLVGYFMWMCAYVHEYRNQRNGSLLSMLTTLLRLGVNAGGAKAAADAIHRSSNALDLYIFLLIERRNDND